MRITKIFFVSIFIISQSITEVISFVGYSKGFIRLDSRLPSLQNHKEAFLHDLTFSKDYSIIDKRLEELTANCSLPSFHFTRKVNNIGKWKIVYAPHIQALQTLSGTSFEVYYNFQDDCTLTSNVFYYSKLFGKGWLNTKGNFEITSNENGMIFCNIKWDYIWWDFNDKHVGPSGVYDTDSHVLHSLIQKIGKAGFIKEFSKFPIEYWDDDLVSFTFPLFGTKIVASIVVDR